MKPDTMAVHALGPVRIAVGKKEIQTWRYSDSPELLIYLLCQPSILRGSGKSPTFAPRTREEIGVALWPEASPEQLRSNLKVRLHDLRVKLGARDRIVYENGRYALNDHYRGSFDVASFEQGCQEAESFLAQSDSQKAIGLLKNVIALYRGDFLEGYQPRLLSKREHSNDDTYEWYVTKRYELQGLYLRALENLAKLQLDSGEYVEAAEVYRKYIANDTSNQDAYYGLLISFMLSGWRSQARHYCRYLREEQSLQPLTPALAELVEQILKGKFTASAAPPPPTQSGSHISFRTETNRAAPLQVPQDLARFVGREAILEELARQVRYASASRPLCLVGMGGIGKSSTAIHLAHSIRKQFPDGILWGNAASSEPLSILNSWANAFGHDYSTLPDVQTRAAALRSFLSAKKILIILDDVRDASQVRQLLVAGAKGRVILTMRDADLAFSLDGNIVPLDGFTPKEGIALCVSILGQERVSTDASAMAEICTLLGHLPLAIDILSHRLASRPRWSLREMVTRLRTQVKRLDELKLGDREVRASISISWDALSDPDKKAFAVLGAFNGRAFSAAAFAYAAQTDIAIARDRLDALVALSLLTDEGEPRYRQHPLLADYAREQLQELDAVEKRLATYYLIYATRHRRNFIPLEDEWDNLTAGVELAHKHELWQTVIDYGDVLTGAWMARGRFSEARQAYPHVMHAARELEEQDPYIAATLNWGRACIDQSDYVEASTHLLDGLQTSREVNDEAGIAQAQFLIARNFVVQSKYADAKPALEESRTLYEKMGEDGSVAEALYLQARIHMETGDYQSAETFAEEALERQKTLAPNHARIVLLRYLGRIADYRDQVEPALNYCQEALAMAESLDDLGEYASALFDLASILRYRGQYEKARDYADKAVGLFQRMGDRKAEMYALQEKSRIAYGLNEFSAALNLCNKSLELAQDLADESEAVYLLIHLSDTYSQLTRLQDACQARTDALRLASATEHIKTTDIEVWLSEHCLNGAS